jgi:hypothetical protein
MEKSQGTPHYDAMRAAGLADASLDPLAQWDPAWIESFMALSEDTQTNDVLEPKLVALIRLNIDVTATRCAQACACGIEAWRDARTNP